MKTREKRRKRITAAAGILAVCMGLSPLQALAASPDFAYTDEEWASLKDNKLEFNEIAALVHEFNTTVQQNLLDYNDYKGKSSTDISNDYYESAGEVTERTSYPEDDSENYASQITSALNSQISADNLIEQGDNNVDDSDTKKLRYEMAEDQIVERAQELMISYWTQTQNLESLKESTANAEKSYRTVLNKKAAGMAVQSDVENAEQSVSAAKASLQSAESSLESTTKNLCVLLGWSYGDEVEIGTVPEPDLAAINAISVDSDIEKALANNYNLKITSIRIGNARSSTVKETQQKTYENQKETISTNVKNAYNSLILAKSSYEQAKESYELQARDLELAKTRLAAGTITKKTYETAESSEKTAKVSMENAKLSLLEAQLSYNWAVNGLASAS